MSWLPPSDGWLSITDTVALSYEIGWLRHRRIFMETENYQDQLVQGGVL